MISRFSGEFFYQNSYNRIHFGGFKFLSDILIFQKIGLRKGYVRLDKVR